MNKRFIRWLYRELPELVSRGVVSGDVAERLREHYGDVKGQSGHRIALTVCSILGSLLIGAGIILLLAHNWEDLSRAVRTILALTPLIVSQAIAIRGVRQGKSSAAWSEGISTFITLAAGASIALVGQTYHIPGDLGSFLLTWMLISVPLVYVMGASLPCVLYFAGITAWSGYEQETGGQALLFWPLFALGIPHIWQEWRKDPYSPRSVVLGWAASLCLCVATGITLEKVIPGLWIIVYSAMFAVLYLAGGYWFSEAPTTAQRPLHSVGAVGIAVLSLLFTFEFPWDDVGWHYYRYGARFHEYAAWADYLLVTSLPVCALCLLVTSVRRGQKSRILFGIIPIIAIIGYGLAVCSQDEFPAMMLFNAYMFALGLGTVIHGTRNLRIGTVNGGMLILTALIIARFFDRELGFVARGIAFILIGAGFLVTNIILVKLAKGGSQ